MQMSGSFSVNYFLSLEGLQNNCFYPNFSAFKNDRKISKSATSIIES